MAFNPSAFAGASSGYARTHPDGKPIVYGFKTVGVQTALRVAEQGKSFSSSILCFIISM